MSRKNKRKGVFWSSAEANTATYWMWYDRLKEIALNSFEWKNLPPSIDPRFLELTLFERGYILFFKDEFADMCFALPAALSGRWNLYNIPVTRRAWANNGYRAVRNNMESVIIYNSYLHTAMEDACHAYAYRLYEIERAIDTNVKAQKTPILIKASENIRMSMKNLYEQYDGNQPFIFGDKKLPLDGLEVLSTDAPYVAGNLQVLKHQYFNEWLSYLGIENSNEDKKERMVASEVGSNYGNVEASRSVRLTPRKEAAEKINAMFGLDIQVEFRSNLNTMVNQAFKPDLAQPIVPDAIGEGYNE